MKIKLFVVTCLFLLFTSLAIAGPVNINTADANMIASSLSGIGESKAQAIVDYRKAHGDFTSVYDLANVKGIGKKTVEKNYDNITLGQKQPKK
jgi:competence protein ComEA